MVFGSRNIKSQFTFASNGHIIHLKYGIKLFDSPPAILFSFHRRRKIWKILLPDVFWRFCQPDILPWVHFAQCSGRTAGGEGFKISTRFPSILWWPFCNFMASYQNWLYFQYRHRAVITTADETFCGVSVITITPYFHTRNVLAELRAMRFISPLTQNPKPGCDSEYCVRGWWTSCGTLIKIFWCRLTTEIAAVMASWWARVMRFLLWLIKLLRRD